MVCAFLVNSSSREPWLFSPGVKSMVVDRAIAPRGFEAGQSCAIQLQGDLLV